MCKTTIFFIFFRVLIAGFMTVIAMNIFSINSIETFIVAGDEDLDPVTTPEPQK